MSSKSRGRTTGPKYKHIKTQQDFTDWLNRAFSRGGRGQSHIEQKQRKADFFPFRSFARARRRRARGR